MKKISTLTAKKVENNASQKLTIGLDLGDRFSWYCVLNEAGEVVLEQKVATAPKAMKEVFGGMPRSRMALETGTHSPWVKVALLARKEGVNEGWIFPSKRAQSGYITDREVSKQWLEAKRLAGIPESVVLYCARHRFSTDAMEGTGNVMAVMDAMGHGSVNTTRIYTHANVQQIRAAIERRNQLSTTPVEAVQ